MAVAHGMDRELQEIDRELTLMFRRDLTVRDLQLRVFVVAEQLGKSCFQKKIARIVIGMASHQLAAKKSCDASQISCYVRINDKGLFIKHGCVIPLIAP
jgi:hypothetical protein